MKKASLNEVGSPLVSTVGKFTLDSSYCIDISIRKQPYIYLHQKKTNKNNFK